MYVIYKNMLVSTDDSPISRIRSPGLFHLHPSSCWCSIYCSRRSWNTTRTMLCRQDQTFRPEDSYSSMGKLAGCWRAWLFGNVRQRLPSFIHQDILRQFHWARVRRWKFREFHLLSYPSYISHTLIDHIREENDPLPLSYKWSVRCRTNSDVKAPTKNLKIPWNEHPSFLFGACHTSGHIMEGLTPFYGTFKDILLISNHTRLSDTSETLISRSSGYICTFSQPSYGYFCYHQLLKLQIILCSCGNPEQRQSTTSSSCYSLIDPLCVLPILNKNKW